jgi:hypothetical protein
MVESGGGGNEVSVNSVAVRSSLIEVSGSAQDALARVQQLREQGWSVAVRGTRLAPSCELVWSLAVARDGS